MAICGQITVPDHNIARIVAATESQALFSDVFSKMAEKMVFFRRNSSKRPRYCRFLGRLVAKAASAD